MRKLGKMAILLLAAAVAAGTLAGCGGSGDVKTDTKADAAKIDNTAAAVGKDAVGEAVASTGNVEFWNDKFLNMEPNDIKRIFDSINSLSGIKVEAVTYPDTAAYQTAMQQSIRGEEAPGLFTWWSGPQLVTLAENGLLEDLTDLWPEYVTANGVSPDIADSFTVDGKIYAVPYSIIYNTLIYNKDVFAKYHLEVPETFDGFLTVCQALKDNGVTPIALKNDSWAGFIWFQAILASYDPQLYQDVCDGTKTYTDKDVVTVMDKWKDMLDKGYFTEPMSIQDMEKSLANGSVAMELEPNSSAGDLVREYGMVAGQDIGTFVLPSMNGHKKAVFFEVTPICVAKASKDRESGKEVIKSWFKKEQQTVLTEITDNVNTSEVQTDNACVNEMISYSTDPENYQMLLRYYENTPEEIRNTALDQLMKFELGNASVDEVLTTIQAKADEVFGK